MSTEENLHAAYTGEAKAVVRLNAYARKAEEEEYDGLAKLFRAVAASESVHAFNNLRLLKDIKDTETRPAGSPGFRAENRRSGLHSFIAEAEAEGKEAVAQLFAYARDVEDRHAKLYEMALQHLVGDEVPEYFVCEVCGYVADTFLPDSCPICGAPAEKFHEVE